MRNWLKDFIQGVLSSNATYSFGRFMSMVISAFVLGWDTAYIVIAYKWNHHLPVGVAPVDFLPSAGMLIAQGGFMTLFYSVTKYGDIKSGLTAQAPPAGPTK